jgi:hypothetical protein
MLVGAEMDNRCMGVRGSVVWDFNLRDHVMHICIIGVNESNSLIPKQVFFNYKRALAMMLLRREKKGIIKKRG